MWLLDANISRRAKPVLIASGFEVKTAQEMGWAELKNGDLVNIAAANGFSCLLTQDVQFINSAAKSLQKHAHFAIVLVRIKQEKGRKYQDSFTSAIAKTPINPIAGKLVIWPKA